MRTNLLATMETSEGSPTPAEAAAALLDAGSARDQLSRRLTMPSWFYSSIGVAVVVQTATLAVGVADQSSAGIGVAVAGVVPFVLVTVAQLLRFRGLNGVWVGGLASRVVLGGDATATTVHFLAMGAAIWAAFDEHWWLVALCAIAGGMGYEFCGVRWKRFYRGDPAAHSRGESVFVLVALVVSVFVGAALLLLGAR